MRAPLLGFRATLIALALAVPLSGTSAHAADPQERYAEGLEAFDEGRFEEALTGFEEAFAATKSPNAKLYVARALTKLGRHDEAYRAMQETLELAREVAGEKDRYAKTRDAAAVEVAELETLVGKLVVGLPETVEDAEVAIDGAPLPATTIGQPWAVLPGEHEVTASAPGYRPWERNVDVAASATETLVVSLEKDGGDPLPPPSPSGGLSTLQGVGIGVGVVGLVGLGVFAGTAAAAQSTFDDLEATCGGVRCTDPALASEVDDGKTMQTVANITAVAGGVLLATGVLMLALGGDDGEEEVALRVGPTGVTALGRF